MSTHESSTESRPVSALPRCAWVTHAHTAVYHDEEWGVPVHDDDRLFEFLVLEGAQSGLSWDTILRKRARYREVFDQFDPARVARYGSAKVARLLADPGIVRNRLKVASAIRNAGCFLTIQAEFGGFATYLWSAVWWPSESGALTLPVKGSWRSLAEVPATTAVSDALSRDLAQRGFNFVGSTIVYAFMQAVGIVDDHTVDCWRYQSSPNQSGPYQSGPNQPGPTADR